MGMRMVCSLLCLGVGAAALPERTQLVIPAHFSREVRDSAFSFPGVCLECRETPVDGRVGLYPHVSDAEHRRLLIAFSQFLYEHPQRGRIAFVAIDRASPTREKINDYIELFPDFALLLPAVSPELREYALRRAELKGVTIHVL